MDYKLVLKIVGATVFIALVILILSIIEFATQPMRYQRYWNNRNQQARQQSDGLLYIALGDSTAQGIGAGAAKQGYVGVISDELAKKHEAVHTINLSKSGATIQDALSKQIPELNKLKVEDNTVVTIEIGANDMSKFNAQTFESQMDELMAALPKQTLISDIPYFGDTRYKDREVYVEQANQIMYKLAKKHGFTLVALHEPMKANGGRRTLALDQFHPSTWAYRENWAKAFLARL